MSDRSQEEAKEDEEIVLTQCVPRRKVRIRVCDPSGGTIDVSGDVASHIVIGDAVIYDPANHFSDRIGRNGNWYDVRQSSLSRGVKRDPAFTCVTSQPFRGT